ncbi:MAG: hypothetical protein FJ290_23035 [Planctomycetes bacterium]|nr:hypothetical protein [Planctomycetota bacterium]
MRRVRGLSAMLLLVAACSLAAEPTIVPHGRLETLNGYTVVSVEGTPEEMGTAYGKLLGPTIRRVLNDLLLKGIGAEPEALKNLLAGSRTMEKFQPQEYLDELKAVAAAADVPCEQLALLQYYGDVRRCTRGAGNAMFCTSFAILPPLTKERVCLVGRNFDYYDHGAGAYASILAYYRPKGRIPFVTVTWAGVINGWTLLNEKGIAVSFNIVAGSRSETLEAVSTCFLLRHVAERAGSVEQGIELVTKASRSCGTNMLVVQGNPPDAALIEFDHARLVVRRPADGFVGATNNFMALYQEGNPPASEYRGRIGVARDLALAGKGELDFSANIAGSDGVPINGMNLHSATLDATNRRLRVAMGTIPACELPSHAFRLTEKGLEADPAANQEPPAKNPLLPQGFWWSREFLLRGVLPCVAVIAIYAVVKLKLASKRRSKR